MSYALWRVPHNQNFGVSPNTFILWHKLTGGFRRQWATKPLHSFAEALEAFRTAVEFRFVRWLITHIDVFAGHKAKSGYV